MSEQIKGQQDSVLLANQLKGSAGVAFNVRGLLLLPPLLLPLLLLPPPPPRKKFSKHWYLHVSHHTQKSNYYQHTEMSSFVAQT